MHVFQFYALQEEADAEGARRLTTKLGHDLGLSEEAITAAGDWIGGTQGRRAEPTRCTAWNPCSCRLAWSSLHVFRDGARI